MIELEDVVMEYGSDLSLDGLRLSVQEGRVYGLRIAGTWRADTLGIENFEELVASTPAKVESRVRLLASELAILVGWTLALASMAGFLSRPRARRTTVAGLEGALGVLPKASPADATRSAR
jgi:hypothetical protein